MNNLLFLDKTGFNLHTSPNYGYYLDGNRPYKVLPANRGRNVSISTMISNTGILYHKMIDEAYTSELFLEFLEECLKKEIFIRNQILVLDNARIYHTQEVTDFFYRNLLHYQFFSTYIP